MIQIETQDYQIIQKILSKYPYQFYVYGSRAKGKARKFSDLDLCYQENIPSEIIYQIKEELEESNLSFIVELVDWKKMSPKFREFIKKDLVLLSERK